MRSIFVCMTLNSGIAFVASSAMTPSSSGMAATSTQVSALSSCTAITMPPIIIIGDMTIMRSIMIRTFCTCVMSLVVRVMSVEVPSLSNSCSE